MDAEWDILYDKLEKLVKSGAQVILSKLPIGDVATQYFADRYMQLFSNSIGHRFNDAVKRLPCA